MVILTIAAAVLLVILILKAIQQKRVSGVPAGISFTMTANNASAEYG